MSLPESAFFNSEGRIIINGEKSGWAGIGGGSGGGEGVRYTYLRFFGFLLLLLLLFLGWGGWFGFHVRVGGHHRFIPDFTLLVEQLDQPGSQLQVRLDYGLVGGDPADRSDPVCQISVDHGTQLAVLQLMGERTTHDQEKWQNGR